MNFVSAGYAGESYEVDDVSAQNLGWDLEARRDDELLLIEVKGVTGSAPDFFLTANEHRAARAEEAWIAVVITDVFSSEKFWYEFSGEDVVDSAKPIQFRVTPDMTELSAE